MPKTYTVHQKSKKPFVLSKLRTHGEQKEGRLEPANASFSLLNWNTNTMWGTDSQVLQSLTKTGLRRHSMSCRNFWQVLHVYNTCQQSLHILHILRRAGRKKHPNLARFSKKRHYVCQQYVGKCVMIWWDPNWTFLVNFLNLTDEVL